MRMKTVRKAQSPSALISDCVILKGIGLNINMVDVSYLQSILLKLELGVKHQSPLILSFHKKSWIFFGFRIRFLNFFFEAWVLLVFTLSISSDVI